MKKSLHLFIVVFLFAGAGIIAQPSLTSGALNPVLGDVFSQKTVAYVSPGNAGANQTWNLSTMTGTITTTSTMVTVGSTPNGSSFPNANEASNSGGGSYGYLKTSATALQNCGVVTGTVVMSYSNLEDLLHFPFNYTNNYTDTWATTFANGGSTYYRKGTDSITYDGYGTLILPSGSYSNVSRVHFVQNYRDSTFVGSPFIITYRNDEYIWYLNGNHAAIASVFTLTNSFTGATTGGNYLNNIVAGINEPGCVINSYGLFPNPATNQVNLSVELNQNQKVQIKLFNSLGAQTGYITADGFQGNNEYKINVSDLPEGVYFAQIHLDGNLVTTRRFIIAR